MENIISVRLRDAGQIYLCDAGNLELKEGDYVILEHDRGLDYGQIISPKNVPPEIKTKETPRKILRKAEESDLKQIQENRLKSKEAFSICLEKIQEHKLSMKLIKAEYSFDRSKIIFYFTAEGRVDFRNLVKDLAKVFKARIELRQIGVRDEAKLFGGFGSCGRALCCTTFLKDFEPVTIKMAKEEGLPLNPPKLSGVCGRLMCCLSFEYETYKILSKGLPREGERINTAQGRGKVISVDVFKRMVTVELEGGAQIQIKIDYKERDGR
ncbi:MAG: stage 0 sporulation family protein [Candidatus Omnitrophica bacterium]|nr:stage 0 sporulation family protein [Candidatus Omnitrophota bacterium]